MVTLRKFGTSLLCAAAAGALALSGCSSGGGGEPAASSSSSSPSSSTSSSESAATTASPTSAAPSAAAPVGPGPDADLATTTFPVDLDRALAVAEEAVPGGIITKIELDFDRPPNAWVWKIDTQQNTDQHEITIDAQSARVLADDRDQEPANPVAVDPRKLTPADAAARATALVPGSVASWTLEWDDGVQRYSFDIRSGTTTEDVDVDVDSGTATRS
ncbi:PepSY domain-containing protein [Mycolicibacterium mengxianglii]|uniref:PepSY domain-containing protein n=1 Tax=Mycolicibacterium mengxianglii TaxID=2736649 RepID=UPI0018D09651|nr:PepSY domain-containing protein [Mycolicibacterium mengxianglii]